MLGLLFYFSLFSIGLIANPDTWVISSIWPPAFVWTPNVWKIFPNFCLKFFCFLDLASILLDTLTLLLKNVKPTLFFTDLDVTAHYRLAVLIKE